MGDINEYIWGYPGFPWKQAGITKVEGMYMEPI